MKEYIEREAAISYIKDNQCKHCSDIGLCGKCAVLTAVKLFESIPAADVVEVRHGKWVVSRTDFGWNCSEFPTHCKCTLCGREVPYQDRDNYCPNCGAKMDGGEN